MASPQTLCRICLRPDPPVGRWSLFECTIAGRPVADVLSEVGGIPVPVEVAAVTRQVCCSDCLQQLEVAFGLRERIREADRRLAEMFGRSRAVTSSGSTVVEEFEIVKVETPDLGSTPSTSSNIKSEPPDSEGLAAVGENTQEKIPSDFGLVSVNAVKSEPLDDEDEMDDSIDDEDEEMSLHNEEVHIKEELSVEETHLQDMEQPVAKRKKFGKHTVAFLVHFEEIMVQPNECCGCRVVFNDFEDLQAHVEAEHVAKRQVEFGKGWHECPRCFQPVQSDKKHRLRGLRCKICAEECSTYFSATAHYRDCHESETSPEQKTCCGCLEKFQTIEQLKLHSNEAHFPTRLPHDSSRPFVCEICYKNYQNYRGLHYHQTRLQTTKPHQCNQCQRSFFYLNALKDHELSHTKEKSFPCPECPKTFTNADALRRHRTRHVIPADKFRCPVETCQKSFKSLKSLREHSYVHTGERPHKCPECEASFSRYDCYTMHVRTMHGSGAEEHRCKVCRKTFGTEQYLARHERSHERPPHSCQHCGQGFSRKEYLRNHLEKKHPEVGGVQESND